MIEKPTKRLLVAEEVAERLAIPVATLRKNVSVNPEAVPPFLKLGNARNSPVRWRESDVEAWIDTQFERLNPEPIHLPREKPIPKTK